MFINSNRPFYFYRDHSFHRQHLVLLQRTTNIHVQYCISSRIIGTRSLCGHLDNKLHRLFLLDFEVWILCWSNHQVLLYFWEPITGIGSGSPGPLLNWHSQHALLNLALQQWLVTYVCLTVGSAGQEDRGLGWLFPEQEMAHRCHVPRCSPRFLLRQCKLKAPFAKRTRTQQMWKNKWSRFVMGRK